MHLFDDFFNCTICNVILFISIVFFIYLIFCNYYYNNYYSNNRYIVGYAYRENCPNCVRIKPYWSSFRDNYARFSDIYEYDVDKRSVCNNYVAKNRLDQLFNEKNKLGYELPYIFVYDNIDNVEYKISNISNPKHFNDEIFKILQNQ